MTQCTLCVKWGRAHILVIWLKLFDEKTIKKDAFYFLYDSTMYYAPRFVLVEHDLCHEPFFKEIFIHRSI